MDIRLNKMSEWALIVVASLIAGLIAVQFGVWSIIAVVGIGALLLIVVNHLNGGQFTIKMWLFFLGFPFFFNIGGPSIISLGSSIFNKGAGQTIPFSLAVLIFMLFLTVLAGAIKKQNFVMTKMAMRYFVLFFLCGVVALFGLFSSNKVVDMLYIFQMVTPFLAYVLMTNLVKTNEQYLSYLKKIIIGGLLGIVLLFISNAISEGVGTIFSSQSFNDKIFFFYVYQIFDYYPVGVAIFTMLTFAWFVVERNPSRKFLLLVLFMIGVIAMTKLNARNAFLMFAVAMVLFFIFSRINLKIKIMLLPIGAVAGLFLVNSDLPVFNRFESADVSVRALRLQEGLSAIHSNPMFGSMFQSDLITGYHNQYLEMAASGGLPFVIAYFLLIVGFLFRAIKFTKKCTSREIKTFSTAIIVIVISVLLASNIAQSNFTQPFTAFLLWALIGLQEAIILQTKNRIKAEKITT